MARRDDDDDDRDRDDEEVRKSSKRKSSVATDDEDDDRADDQDDDDDDAPKKKKKLSDDDKLWGMLAHFSSFIMGIIGPLVVMMMYKEKSKFVEAHAKEALNFDITMVIIVFCTLGCGVIVVAPMSLIYHIMAGLAANKGEKYKYPMTLRLVK